MDGDVKCVRLKGSDGTDVAQNLITTNIVAKAPAQGWEKSVSRYERNLKSMLDWLQQKKNIAIYQGIGHHQFFIFSFYFNFFGETKIFY